MRLKINKRFACSVSNNKRKIGCRFNLRETKKIYLAPELPQKRINLFGISDELFILTEYSPRCTNICEKIGYPLEKKIFVRKEDIMSKWPQRKDIKSSLDLYAYIAYLAALTFIISAKFLSGIVSIILAISTILIFLVALALTYFSEKNKQSKEQNT